MEKMKTGSAYYQPECREAMFMDPAKRDPVQAMMAHTGTEGSWPPTPRSTLKRYATSKEDDAKRYAELKKQLAEFDSIKPEPLPEAQFMTDISSQAPKTFLLQGGNLDLKGDEIQPGIPVDSRPVRREDHATLDIQTRPSHCAGCVALTDPKNPLVARVMVTESGTTISSAAAIAATPGISA